MRTGLGFAVEETIRARVGGAPQWKRGFGYGVRSASYRACSTASRVASGREPPLRRRYEPRLAARPVERRVRLRGQVAASDETVLDGESSGLGARAEP